jgi:isoprenylcysteine carboxyl methyltransferase (ICMT) family protein YpbQ
MDTGNIFAALSGPPSDYRWATPSARPGADSATARRVDAAGVFREGRNFATYGRYQRRFQDTPIMLVGFIILAVLFRLATLLVSFRNERRLKAHGAVEIGAANSIALAIAHTLFYLAAIAESFWSGGLDADATAGVGVVIYLFAAIMLIVVIRSLGRFWSIKLLIASDHVLVTNPLFRWIRHPNYYLNILPELIGFALALHAFRTLAIGLPLYLIPLVIRIRQEEAAMRTRFAAY